MCLIISLIVYERRNIWPFISKRQITINAALDFVLIILYWSSWLPLNYFITDIDHSINVQSESRLLVITPLIIVKLSNIRLFSLIIELNIGWKVFVSCYLLSMFNKLHKPHCHLYFFCSFTPSETIDHFQTSFFQTFLKLSPE